MDAKKCDRCGSFYEIRNTTIIEDLAEAFNVTTHAEDLHKIMEMCVDLCPDCSKQLLKWLKGREFE
jgi:hypothetical protein